LPAVLQPADGPPVTGACGMILPVLRTWAWHIVSNSLRPSGSPRRRSPLECAQSPLVPTFAHTVVGTMTRCYGVLPGTACAAPQDDCAACVRHLERCPEVSAPSLRHPVIKWTVRGKAGQQTGQIFTVRARDWSGGTSRAERAPVVSHGTSTPNLLGEMGCTGNQVSEPTTDQVHNSVLMHLDVQWKM
jgi:hypothetical protein